MNTVITYQRSCSIPFASSDESKHIFARTREIIIVRSNDATSNARNGRREVIKWNFIVSCNVTNYSLNIAITSSHWRRSITRVTVLSQKLLRFWFCNRRSFKLPYSIRKNCPPQKSDIMAFWKGSTRILVTRRSEMQGKTFYERTSPRIYAAPNASPKSTAVENASVCRR